MPMQRTDKLIDTLTGAYPVYEWQIKQSHRNTSFPIPFEPLDRYEWVYAAPKPNMPPAVEVEEGTPEKLNGVWVENWKTRAAKPEEYRRKAAELLASYTTRLDAHIDSVAKARRYDSRVTCAMRAGFPGPWQEEAKAFGTWMDTCYTRAYAIMLEVEAGNRELPTFEQLLAELPAMIWPN